MRPQEYHDLPPAEELAKIMKAQTPEALENDRRKREAKAAETQAQGGK